MVYLGMAGTERFAFSPDPPEVWIGGTLRRDARCLSVNVSAEHGEGGAQIGFPRAKYDAEMCLENDLVEVRVGGVGVIHRGYITGRAADGVDELVYESADYLEKFNSVFFWHDYNVYDDVARQMLYPALVRDIAADAYGIYQAWRAGYCPGDYELGIDLESFPAVDIPEVNEQAGIEQGWGDDNLRGQPLLMGLRGVLEKCDRRWRIGIRHEEERSTIVAFMLGEGGAGSIVRGTDPTQSYARQPGGVALVGKITRGTRSRDCMTLVYAEGASRMIERALVLVPGWNEVATGYTPPEGHTIKEYVTEYQRNEIINNWEKYTKKQIAIPTSNAANRTQKAVNPNWRKQFERVCAVWMIPEVDDRHYFNDDPENYPTVYGSAARRVKIESELVQELTAGEAMRPFLVVKRVGDDTLYVKEDGFTIHESREVRLEKPLADRVSNIIAMGNQGEYVSYDSEQKTSVYGLKLALTQAQQDAVTAQFISGGGAWLILSEKMLYYKIGSMGTDGDRKTTLTVAGNLSGAGVAGNEGLAQMGGHWCIVNRWPGVEWSGSELQGVGKPGSEYQIYTDVSDEITNEYAGMYLILGEYDVAGQGFLGAPADMKMYRIAYNSLNTLRVEGDVDLTGASAQWTIVNPCFSTLQPYEWVALNCAYRSEQRLAWNSGNVSEVYHKRAVYKGDPKYEWKTCYQNYMIQRSTVEGEEDKTTLVYNESPVDKVKQLEGLQRWATGQVGGATAYEVTYGVTLSPIDWALGLGQQLIDTGIEQPVSITGMRYDFRRWSVEIEAQSWKK